MNVTRWQGTMPDALARLELWVRSPGACIARLAWAELTHVHRLSIDDINANDWVVFTGFMGTVEVIGGE